MLSRHFYAITGLVTLLSAIGLSSTHFHAAAPSPSTSNVIVTNTAANPVPTVVNTLPAVQIASGQNVGISGTPTVNIAASQNVGISGTPTVNIGANQTVGINNTDANPVSVKEASGHTPVSMSQTVGIPAGQFATFATLYTAPAGKYFTLRDISVLTGVPTGQHLVLMGLSGDFNSAILTAYLPLGTPATFSGSDYYTSLTTGASWEFDPATPVSLQVNRSDSTGAGVFIVTFNGYLSDTP